MRHELLTLSLLASTVAALSTGQVNSAFAQEQAGTSAENPYVGPLTDDSVMPDAVSPVTLTYLGIFYGPSVKKPSSYQPDGTGAPDKSQPIFMKNFLGLGFNLSENVNVSGNAFWSW